MSQDLENFCIFLRFFGNRPLRENFENCVPTEFIATPIDVLCSNFVKFGEREISEVVGYLPDKKQNFAWLSSSRYFADRSKICQGKPPTMYLECSRFHPNRFTFVRARSKVNPIFG